jgi:hypothetical protein
MANANIAQLQLNNTFNEWRVITNVLANSTNDLRNGNYVKDEGNLIIASGNVIIAKPTGTTLVVASDASVANQLTVKTFVATDDITVNGANAQFTNACSYVQVANSIFTKNLISNTIITGQNTITTDLTVGSSYANGNCFIQGDPEPSRTPVYQDGTFVATRRGLNFRGTGIGAITAVANVSNTKIIDIVFDAPSTAGNPGVKGDKGAPGDTGAQGAQGAQGFQGFQGAQGVQGVQGHQGVQGGKGEPGTGGVGLKGDKGEQGAGDKGFQGTKGQKGEVGGSGDIGDKGDKGDKGNQGTAGTSGDKGAKGDQGAQGSKGDKGTPSGTTQLVKAYVSFTGSAMLPGDIVPASPITINGSNNVSSITVTSDRNYDGGFWGLATPLIQIRINFTTPMTDQNYAVAGTARKPNNTEMLYVYGTEPKNYYYSASGHMQLLSRNANYVVVAFAITGAADLETTYYIPSQADVIVVRE